MVEPATAHRQIKTELSSRQVALEAGQATAVFGATVYNDSERFASFQVKLLAAGMVPNSNKPWYRLTPSVSSKIPAGDCVRFQIEVFDLPPIDQQFRGSIDLTVEVTSRELENQYDRQSLRLLVEGLQAQPPSLTFVSPQLQGAPGDRVTIATQVHNPTSIPMEATLRLSGLPDTWFPEGVQRTLTLAAKQTIQVAFTCEIPAPTQAPSQVYPLTLEASGRFPAVTATSRFSLLPAGVLSFTCDPLETSIPEHLGRWLNPRQGTAHFTLQFANQSNVAPPLAVQVQELQPPRRRWPWQKPPETQPTEPVGLAAGVSLAELPVALPAGTTHLPMQIQRPLPWLGWTRLKRFEVTAQTIDCPLPLQNDRQGVQLHLFPVIPLWQQIVGVLLFLGLGTLAVSLLADPGHGGPVNSVQFSGQGTEVLSGSDDQTIRRWRVRNQHLRTQSRSSNLQKAVRLARYRPVSNDQVAIGFENGEIQLANLLTGSSARLNGDRDDRVFGLAFSRDARSLYSGHGSGLVLQWEVGQFVPQQTTPRRAYDVQFAIQALTTVGEDDRHLAVAGRYNRLVLLPLQAEAPTGKQTTPLLELPYRSGGASDYITSLAVAEQQPNLLAVSDTQGQVSVWNPTECIQKRGRCGPIDQPWLGHNGSPIRGVALSADGCFLASAGDDGEVKLWPLDGTGMRRSSALQGRVLGRSQRPLNAVDVIQTRDSVWVTSGGDDGRVRLYRVRLANESRLDRCPVLAGG